MGKKLLIIGNGFDLAHKLPTSYMDFLDFTRYFRRIFTCEYGEEPELLFFQDLKSWNGHAEIKNKLECLFKTRKNEMDDESKRKYRYSLGDSTLEHLNDYLTSNVWIDYFHKLCASEMMKGINWIDFESEISQIIKWLDYSESNMYVVNDDLIKKMIVGDTSDEKTRLFHSCIPKNKDVIGITVEDLANYLYNDLERLTLALNIYLSHFVEKVTAEPIDIIKNINPDYVISFNYTSTYQRVYGDKVPISYIHGQCGLSEKESNMVLGIDEYLPRHECDSNTNYVIFKKFVQRIRKRNSVEYQMWRDEIYNDYLKYNSIINKSCNSDYFGYQNPDIYVYGHSLDVTDKDILELFLSPDYCKIHLFAKGKINEGRIISNLIKIISEKSLIKKSTSNPSMLELCVI